MKWNKKLTAAVFVLLVLPIAAFAADPPLPLSVEGYVFNADGSPAPTGVSVTVVNINNSMLEETATSHNYPPLPEYANRYSVSLGYSPGAGQVVQVLAQSGSWFGEASTTASSGKLEINVTLAQQTPSSQPSLSGTIERLKEEAAVPKQPASGNETTQGSTGQQPSTAPIVLPQLKLPSTPEEVANTIAYISVGLIVLALIILIPFIAKRRRKEDKKGKKRKNYGFGLLVAAIVMMLVVGLPALAENGQQGPSLLNTLVTFLTDIFRAVTALATGGEEGGAGIAAPPSTVAVDGFVFNNTFESGSLTGNGTLVNVTVSFPNGTIRNIEQTWTGNGFPPALQFFPQYSASLTGEIGVDTVNVTATNGTHVGRNSSIAASSIKLNVSISEPLPEGAPPRWFNNVSLTPTNYSPTFISQFNVTWVDNSGVANVTFELDVSGAPVNYSPTLQSGSVYSFTTVIQAGTFHWRSFATDMWGNQNVTDRYGFTVGTAANPVDLWLNGFRNQNVTIGYGTQSNATGTSAFGTVTLYRDGASVSNPEIDVLGAKSAGYAYKVNATGNANYSDNSTGVIYYLIVNKAGSSITLLLNGTNGDLTYPQNGVANFTITTSPSGLPVQMWTNFSDSVNKLWDSGNSPFTNFTVLNAAGKFNFTGVFVGNQNYTAVSATHFVTVTGLDTEPPRWFNNVSLTPASYSPTFNSQFNVTWMDNVGVSNATFELDISGAPANYSPTLQSGSVYSFTTVIPAGTFHWRSFATDISGNQNVTDRYGFIVGTAANPVDLYLNGNRNSNLTITYGTQSNATGTSAFGTVALFRDGATVGNPEKDVLGANAAGYAYKVNATGNANYSVNSTGLTFYLIVNPVAVTMQLLLNGTNGNQGYLLNNPANITISTAPSGLPVSLFSNFSDGVNKLLQSGNSPLVNLTTLNTNGVWNFTGVFAGNQNYTAASATHFANVTGFDMEPPRWVNANSSTQTPTEGSSLILDANWTDNMALDKAVLSTNETGSFINYTAFYSSPISMNGASFESSFTWSNSSFAAGAVIAWRIYANDTSGNQNVTPINTFTIQAAPPSPPPAGGGGGGAGGAYVPPAKALYQTKVSPLIERGQPIDLVFNITNPTVSSYDVYAVTSIASGGAEVYHANVTITVQPSGSTMRTQNAGTHLCSEPAPGLYEVSVVWHLGSNGAVVDSNLVRYGVVECTDGEITLTTDKSGYGSNDTARIDAAVKNVGNVPLKAKLQLNLTQSPEKAIGDYDVELLVGQSKTFSTQLDLRDLQNGTHMLKVVLYKDHTIYDEKSLSFAVMRGVIIVVAPIPIELLLLGLFALLLMYMLNQLRKPIKIIKEAEALDHIIRVTLTAINLRPYPFRDVVIEDTLPAEYEPKQLRPRPYRYWLVEGGTKVQWRFNLAESTEEKQGIRQFTYTLREKDVVKGLPKPHLIYSGITKPVKLLKEAERKGGLVFVTVNAINKRSYGFKDIIAEDTVPEKYEIKRTSPRPYRTRIINEGDIRMRWMFDIPATTFEKQGQAHITYVLRLKKVVDWLPRPILRKYTREELCG